MKYIAAKYFYWFLVIMSGYNDSASATKISVRLASSVCHQIQAYGKDGKITSPKKRPEPNEAKLCGRVTWKPCDQSGCRPFITIEACDNSKATDPGHNNKPKQPSVNTKPNPQGNTGQRHRRTPVEGNSYPYVAGLVLYKPNQPDYIRSTFFFGNAFFIDSKKLLTTGVIAKRIKPTSKTEQYKLVFGETSASKYQEDVKIQRTTLHPNFNETTLENNFGLLHLDNDVCFDGKVSYVSLAQPGQKCGGTTKYASWAKMKLGGGEVYGYHDQLHEVTSVNMIEGVKCRESAFCTHPLLCGLWDQGGPLICSQDGNEFAYAISSEYFIDYEVCGEICGGYSTFLAVENVVDWVEKTN